MKRLNKKSVILAALGLLIGSGAYLNYQMSKTDTTGMSDLTLANLEAMAWELDDPNNPDMGLDGAVDISQCASATMKTCYVRSRLGDGTYRVVPIANAKPAGTK